MPYLWGSPDFGTLKFLLLITGLGMGGAERQVTDLADQFVMQGHEVLLVYLTGDAIVLPSSSEVQVVGLGMRKRIVGFIKAYMQLSRLIPNFKPDVVHSHMVHANLLARFLRLSVAIPRLICTAHSTNEGGALRMLAYRLTDRLADINTNVSIEAIEAFVGKGAVKKERMLAVTNGIDTKRFAPDPQARERVRKEQQIRVDEKVILAVGRLVEAKDYPNLLNAYASLGDVGIETKLWIAGGGELLSKLEHLAKRLGVEKRVKFLGVQRDVAALMNAADVFVLSSAWEGFALVLGEAMACGRVVVATDCGGVKELFGGDGILAPPRNTTELSCALGYALKLPEEEAQRRGNAARQRIQEHFSLKKICDNWMNLYRGVGTD